MKNKSIIIAISVILVLTIAGAGFWVVKNKEGDNRGVSQEKIENNIVIEEDQQQNQGEEKEFVVDVDMDMDHWQTKETEFFTIKFPKEWYWLESDLKKTGYHSQVITNNSYFDINRYADIGFFTGGKYLYTSKSEGVESMPLQLNNTEIVITYGVASTSDAGTPQDSINAIFKSEQDDSTADCSISNNKKIPFTVYCSDIYDSQLQQSYHIINNGISLTITARTTNDTLVKKEILDKIAESIILKQHI